MHDELWSRILAAVGVLAAVLFGLAAMAAAVWLMIWPIERLAQANRGRFRFRLVDLGCLLVYWQLLLAAMAAILRTNHKDVLAPVVVVVVALAIALSMAWAACASVLSRAGIESSARRATFMLVLLPGAVAASVTLVMSGGVAAATMVRALLEGTAPEPVPLSILIFFADLPAIYLLRLVSLWIAAGASAS